MKIVVIGGTGLVGSKLTSSLGMGGSLGRSRREVLQASPSTGVDIINGSGLRQALVGAHVVVDVADSPSFRENAAFEFFETAGRNLMTAEKAAGLRHHVALSIIGIDRNPRVGYFRAKLLQESFIKSSGIAYTIVRSTQFFESVADIADADRHDEAVRASPALVQPVASSDVADALAAVALQSPLNATIEVAGPDRLPCDELVSRYLLARGDLRTVISDVHATYFGLELNDKSLTPGDRAHICTTHFGDWLNEGTD